MKQRKKKTKPMPTVAALKIGKYDDSGNKITDVLARGNEYAIYEVEATEPEKRLRVLIDGYDDDSERVISDRFNAVKPQYVHAKGLLYRASNFNLMKSRLGHALARVLYSDTYSTPDQIEKLISEINAEYKSLFPSRLLFLAPGYMTLAGLSLLLSVNFMRSYFVWPVVLWDVLIIALAGLLGGVFSQTFALRFRPFETGLSRLMYVLLGFERVFLAVIAAIIVYFGVKSNVIMGFLNEKPDGMYSLMFIASVAGFSETFLPSIMDRFIRDNRS